MPLYEYECEACGHRFEKIQKFSDVLESVCPKYGGAGYLQILADLANRPRPVLNPASVEDPADSTYRWRKLVEPLLAPEAVRLHRRFVAIRFTLTELARRSRDGHKSETPKTETKTDKTDTATKTEKPAAAEKSTPAKTD